MEERCSITEILEYFREVNARQVQQIEQMEESSAEIKGSGRANNQQTLQEHIFSIFRNLLIL